MFQAKYLIYALLDPSNGTVRYIGASTTGMGRPKHHWNPSGHRGRSYRANWIRGLRAAGTKYGIFILEVVQDRASLDEAERRWIKFGRTSGWRLTNLTDGGEGSGPRPDLAAYRRSMAGKPGRIQSQEEIEKRRLTLIGNKRGLKNKSVDTARTQKAISHFAQRAVCQQGNTP